MSGVADPCEILVAGLRAIGEVSNAAETEARRLPMQIQRVGPREDVLSEGDRLSACHLIIDGVFARYTTLHRGQRQISSIHLRSDIPDLHGLYASTADVSLSALTPGRVARIAHADLQGAIATAPDLGVLLWRVSLSDAAIVRARLVSIGVRPAYQRVAHFFCETLLRMRALGLADETRFALPLTQAELGSVLGLSAVHVNRTLQQLRRDEVISSQARYHVVTDWRRLCEAGDFDASYLAASDRRTQTFR